MEEGKQREKEKDRRRSGGGGDKHKDNKKANKSSRFLVGHLTHLL